MVLDEDALEGLLKRQNTEATEDEAKESKQIELTHQTEEFEVYEKDPGVSKTGVGLNAPELDPSLEAPGITPEVVDELAPEPTPTPSSPTEPETEDEPEPEPEVEIPTEPVIPEAFKESPETVPEPEPTTAAPTRDESEPVNERPRVWPPLSGNRGGQPTVVEQDAPGTPSVPVDDEMEPEPVAAPTPPPEPAAESESVQEDAAEVPTDDDPHAHAHADLNVDGGGVRIAIVQALFNQDITDMMADLAVAKAKKRGAKVTHHLTVPGVYDLPLVTARLLEQADVDCAVVIGVVVEGETEHDKLITHATARTLQQLSLDVDKPIGLGITGPGMTWKQAEARVANGAHAVDAALAQVEAIKALSS